MTCSKAVEKLGKLTPGLKRAFENAQTMSEVEDLVRNRSVIITNITKTLTVTFFLLDLLLAVKYF